MPKEVDNFFEEAADHGYDRAKIRRCIEEETRRIGKREPELFDKILFTNWKILKMQFGTSSKKDNQVN